MSDALLRRANFDELSDHAAQVSASIRAGDLPRLLPLITNGDADVDVEMRFERTATGAPGVTGRIRSELVVPCQRCLGDVPQAVDVTFALAVVANVFERNDIPNGYEPLFIGDVGRLADVVEQELLLALPDYPRHDTESDCDDISDYVNVADTSAEETAAHPFEILKQLKSD